MINLEASAMDIMVSAQEYNQLIHDKKQALERNEELVKELRTQEEWHQLLLKQFTKVKEESMELKMQIKDLSKQALKLNRYHLVREGDMEKKQKGLVETEKEHRERAVKLEEEVLSVRQELERKEQIIKQLEQKEQGQIAVQSERVPQLEEEVLRLKQELDSKDQMIQKLTQAEGELKAKLALEAKSHLETIEKLKQENNEIVVDLLSKLDKLAQEKESQTAGLNNELQQERLKVQQIKNVLQIKESEFEIEKTAAETAYKQIEDLLTSEKQKSQQLQERTKKLKISLAMALAEKEKLEKKLKDIEEERMMYKKEAEGYINTWNEMRKFIHQSSVQISISEGGSFQNSELARDKLNFSGPADMEQIFSTISSIRSSCSKRRAAYQELQERCKVLESEKSALTLELQEIKGKNMRGSQSTSFSQQNSSLMRLDISFEEIQKRESMIQSQKVEIQSQRGKYKKLRDKYENLKYIKQAFEKKQGQVQKLTQQNRKLQTKLNKLQVSISSLGKFS